MILQLNRPLIIFDLETTGTDPHRDRIIELATIKLRPDGSREEKTRRFNPGISIPREATAVHNISDEDVRNEPHFANVAKSIHAYFEGCDLAGYNIIDFDIPMLVAELERAGRVMDISKVSVVDAFQIFRTKEPRNLGGAVRFYCGRAHGDAHQAHGDAVATLDVLEAQLNRYPELPRNPAELDIAVRDPESVDRGGKLRWIDGEVAIGFGRHRGKTLRYLSVNEPDYIHWMINNKVVGDAVHHLHDALIGHFATREKKPDTPAS